MKANISNIALTRKHTIVWLENWITTGPIFMKLGGRVKQGPGTLFEADQNQDIVTETIFHFRYHGKI